MDPDDKTSEKLFVAAMAAAAAYALAGGLTLLLLGPLEGCSLFGGLAAVSAVIFALIPARARAIFLLLGILLFAASFAPHFGGGHSPLAGIAFLGLFVAAAAVAAELCVRAFRLVRRRRDL